MYLAIDRKAENWAEVQNSACGRSGTMMRLRIVKSDKNEKEQKDDEDNIPHGKKEMKELVMPWANMDRVVCEDSYFASVPAAEIFWNNGLYLIGVIMTVTRKFPMAYLSNIELQNWGDTS